MTDQTNVSHDSETLATGQQVITAVAMIWRKNSDGQYEVFLPRRAKTKKFLPDVFEMPGGHIDYGEDIVDGLQREIIEEFNMKTSIGDPFAVFTYVNTIKGSHSIEVVYFGQFIDPVEKIQIHAEDHSEFGWFTREYLLPNKETMRAGNEAASTKDTDDSDRELEAILKGLDLLEGQSPNFATR